MKEKGLKWRREEIVEAAIQVFNKEGFFEAKMEDIASTAGIAKGTIYQYYASKEELIEASIDYMVDRFEKQFEETLAKADTALEKIQLLIHVAVTRVYELQPLVNFNLVAFLSHHPKKQELFVNRFQKWKNQMEAILNEGFAAKEIRRIDTEVFYSIFFGTLFQLCHQRQQDEKPEKKRMEEVEKALEDILLNGILYKEE